MKLETRKPLIQSNLLPEEILGEDLPFVESHYRAVKHATTTEEHDKMVKRLGFELQELESVGKAYERLRDKGYWVAGTDKHGNLLFRQALMSDLQVYVETFPLIPRSDFNLYEWLR